MHFPIRPFAVAALLTGATASHATIIYTGGNYSQNFDTLATTGSSNQWVNDVTLPGWSMFIQPAPGTAVTSYGADSGGSNTGAFNSYGATSSTERALGGLGSGGAYFGAPASGSIAGWITVAARNATGTVLDSFTVAFNGEQWRNGGNTAAQTMVLQYGFGTSFDLVANWLSPGGAFDWSSPVIGASAAAVNGNVAGLVTNRGGTINTTWNANDTLWIRWVERNDTGNDHGLAIDNFTLSAVRATVPEPGSLALVGLALIGMAARRRKQ